VAGDSGKLVTFNNAAAITVTVPTYASVAYATGTQITYSQTGAGQVTLAGDTGVTVNATPGLKLRAQYSGATLVKIGTDSWLLLGDLSA
jgi:beta-lactamase superfamily II metal-dependent hydrolase